MSSVAYLNLNAYQNESFDAVITIDKAINKLTFDASYFELKGQIRKHYLSAKCVDFEIKLANPSVGSSFNISLTPEQTKNLKAGRYVYDIFAIDRTSNIGKYSVYFSGTSDDYLSIKQTDVNVTKFNINKNQFTIDLWLYPEEALTDYTIISIGDGFFFGVENSTLVLKNGINNIFSRDHAPEQKKWTQIKLYRQTNAVGNADPTKCSYSVFYNFKKYFDLNDITPVAEFTGTDVKIGTSFKGYISNLMLLNNFYYPDEMRKEILFPASSAVLLTCRDKTFKDFSDYNFDVVGNGNAGIKNESPFVVDNTSYKLMEGCFFVNPSSSNFTV
jgi:hypothetical protein